MIKKEVFSSVFTAGKERTAYSRGDELLAVYEEGKLVYRNKHNTDSEVFKLNMRNFERLVEASWDDKRADSLYQHYTTEDEDTPCRYYVTLYRKYRLA